MAVVEIPKGGRNKYEYDPELGGITFDRLLMSAAAYPADRCIHQLFEAQAARTPDATAVTYGGDALTYRALNARANRVARYLARLGVGPEVRVGLCLERGLDVTTAIEHDLSVRRGERIPMILPLPSVAGKQFIYRSWLVSSAPSAAPKCGWIGEISRCGRIELAQ